MWNAGVVEVIFERAGDRRYAVEVHRLGVPALRMDPAPGFDQYFPHDLQHLIVEEQLGIADGIFGRLAKGGTASTFHPVAPDGSGDDRARSRQQRRLRRRNDRMGAGGSPDFGRSERATFIVWHDWLTHCPEHELRSRAEGMSATAGSILDRMGSRERLDLCTSLPRVRVRVDTIARRWASLTSGQSMSVTRMPSQRVAVPSNADPGTTGDRWAISVGTDMAT